MKHKFFKKIILLVVSVLIVVVSYLFACYLYIRHPIPVPEQLLQWYDTNHSNFSDIDWLQKHGFKQTEYGVYQVLGLSLDDLDFNGATIEVYTENQEDDTKVEVRATQYRQTLTTLKEFLFPWDDKVMITCEYVISLNGKDHVYILVFTPYGENPENILNQILLQYF